MSTMYEQHPTRVLEDDRLFTKGFSIFLKFNLRCFGPKQVDPFVDTVFQLVLLDYLYYAKATICTFTDDWKYFSLVSIKLIVNVF